MAMLQHDGNAVLSATVEPLKAYYKIYLKVMAGFLFFKFSHQFLEENRYFLDFEEVLPPFCFISFVLILNECHFLI